MTSPELLKPLRSTRQVLGDRKRSTIARTLADVRETYFILLDRGVLGMVFDITNLAESKAITLVRIRKYERVNSEQILAVYKAHGGMWQNVTDIMIALAREGDTT